MGRIVSSCCVMRAADDDTEARIMPIRLALFNLGSMHIRFLLLDGGQLPVADRLRLCEIVSRDSVKAIMELGGHSFEGSCLITVILQRGFSGACQTSSPKST
jgi:hypothetical protein